MKNRVEVSSIESKESANNQENSDTWIRFFFNLKKKKKKIEGDMIENHRITETQKGFGLKGTFKDDLVQPPTTGKNTSY